LGARGSLRSVLSQVEAVSGTNTTVLITGETGTGKEVIARAIHELSPAKPKSREGELRRHACRPFSKASSSDMNAEPLRAPLILTSAVLHWRIAALSSLDELGTCQWSFNPSCSAFSKSVNSRPLAARVPLESMFASSLRTNQDLKQMVRDREFREDLYYRLNAFPIYLPPLRERKADIPELVEYFVSTVCNLDGQIDQIVPQETMRSLVRHTTGPATFESLQNYIARGVILSNDGIFEPGPLESCEPPEPEIANPTLQDKVRREILVACQRANWKLGGPRGAAARLGMKRTTLFHKMKRLGISRPADHWQAESRSSKKFESH